MQDKSTRIAIVILSFASLALFTLLFVRQNGLKKEISRKTSIEVPVSPTSTAMFPLIQVVGELRGATIELLQFRQEIIETIQKQATSTPVSE